MVRAVGGLGASCRGGGGAVNLDVLLLAQLAEKVADLRGETDSPSPRGSCSGGPSLSLP